MEGPRSYVAQSVRGSPNSPLLPPPARCPRALRGPHSPESRVEHVHSGRPRAGVLGSGEDVLFFQGHVADERYNQKGDAQHDQPQHTGDPGHFAISHPGLGWEIRESGEIGPLSGQQLAGVSVCVSVCVRTRVSACGGGAVEAWGGGGSGGGQGPQRLARPPPHQGPGERGLEVEQEDGGSARRRGDGARGAVRLQLPAQAPPRVSNEAAISSAACKINVIGIMLQFDLSTGFN